MNGQKAMTGAKPKAHYKSESGINKNNRKNDTGCPNGNRTKLVNGMDTAARKFSPHLPEKVAMQLLEKGSLLRVCTASSPSCSLQLQTMARDNILHLEIRVSKFLAVDTGNA